MRAAADVGPAPGQREIPCTVGGRNDSGTGWATPLEPVEAFWERRWPPFSLAPVRCFSVFGGDWPPFLIIIAVCTGNCCPDFDSKVAPFIIDKYNCPTCQKRQPIIRFQATLGQCTRCNTWLGSTTLDPPSPETIEWQEWVISALDELRRTIVSTGALFWEQFFTNISQSFEAKGEQSRLAQLAGLARGQLATWLRRSHTPTLQSILEFCYVCNVTPLQVLTGKLSPLKRIIQESKPYRPPRARRLVRPLDREYCLERIQALLDGNEEPLGYVQLAQQLGYSSQVLLYHFPQECALLSKQIKEHRRQRKEQRIARVQEEVRQATLALHAQGIYPSQNKVADLLSDPNLLFQPEAKATWRALCQELGWDRKNESVL